MPRAATTSDAFNAVAEPRRREILSYLAVKERPVGDIVKSLRLEQPSVSKHLRVYQKSILQNQVSNKQIEYENQESNQTHYGRCREAHSKNTNCGCISRYCNRHDSSDGWR